MALDYELVLSHWLYSFTIIESGTKLVVGLHQEDERSQCCRRGDGHGPERAMCDIGIVIVRVEKERGEVVVVGSREFVEARQCYLEADLAPGDYIIIPKYDKF